MKFKVVDRKAAHEIYGLFICAQRRSPFGSQSYLNFRDGASSPPERQLRLRLRRLQRNLDFLQ